MAAASPTLPKRRQKTARTPRPPLPRVAGRTPPRSSPGRVRQRPPRRPPRLRERRRSPLGPSLSTRLPRGRRAPGRPVRRRCGFFFFPTKWVGIGRDHGREWLVKTGSGGGWYGRDDDDGVGRKKRVCDVIDHSRRHGGGPEGWRGEGFPSFPV